MKNYQKVDMHIYSICKTAYIVLLCCGLNYPFPTFASILQLFYAPQSSRFKIRDICKSFGKCLVYEFYFTFEFLKEKKHMKGKQDTTFLYQVRIILIWVTGAISQTLMWKTNFTFGCFLHPVASRCNLYINLHLKQ